MLIEVPHVPYLPIRKDYVLVGLQLPNCCGREKYLLFFLIFFNKHMRLAWLNCFTLIFRALGRNVNTPLIIAMLF